MANIKGLIGREKVKEVVERVAAEEKEGATLRKMFEEEDSQLMQILQDYPLHNNYS